MKSISRVTLNITRGIFFIAAVVLIGISVLVGVSSPLALLMIGALGIVAGFRTYQLLQINIHDSTISSDSDQFNNQIIVLGALTLLGMGLNLVAAGFRPQAAETLTALTFTGHSNILLFEFLLGWAKNKLPRTVAHTGLVVVSIYIILAYLYVAYLMLLSSQFIVALIAILLALSLGLSSFRRTTGGNPVDTKDMSINSNDNSIEK